MNDRVKDHQQHQQRVVPVVGSNAEVGRPDAFGLGVRIDPAHTHGPELITRGVEWQELEHFVPATPSSASVAHQPLEMPVSESHSADDVGHLFQRIQRQIESQKTVLSQREQALSHQRTTVEEEQRRTGQRLATELSQLDAKKIQIQKNETLFAERLINFELQSRKFETEREAFQHQRTELERQKKMLREDILADLHAQKTELTQARATFEKDFENVRVLKEALHSRLQTLAEENSATLQAEREKLWNSLTEEWNQRNQAFQQEQEAWSKTRELEKNDIDREKVMFESAVESANAEFLKTRDLLNIELSALREHQSKQLESERRAWDETRQSQKSELDSQTESFNAEMLASREALSVELKSLRDEQVESLTVEREQWQKSRQTEESDLLALRDALELEIASLREKHHQELLAERNEWNDALAREQAHLDLAKTELIASRTALEVEFTDLRQSLTLELAELRESHDAELVSSRSQHDGSLLAEKESWEQFRDADNKTVKAELDELLAACDKLALEMKASREDHENSLAIEREEWEQTRAREIAALKQQQSELLLKIDELKLELIQLRQQHDEMLASERADWEHVQSAQQAEFNTQQAEWMVSRDAAMQASRDALELEFMALRSQHAAKLQAEREEWGHILGNEKAVLEERHSELIRERSVIENRLRFQQDHLDKSRAELELTQNEYRRERQVERTRIEETSALMVRRLRQIDLYRSSIDAREKSLDREHEVFSRARKTLSSTAELDRMNHQAERQVWEQERQIQQQELRRQQETLTTRAEGLESRRLRLDKLRAELEETHRATLEMRLAVEEAWAQLTQASGQDEARQKVEDVRVALTGYYQEMYESVAQQRREHVDIQTKFEKHRAEFAEERQKLTSWFTGRDEELRLGEERLRLSANEASANHAKWLAARDRWLLEKTEAEQLIRRLLASLGDNNREQSGELELSLGVDQISRPLDDVYANLDR